MTDDQRLRARHPSPAPARSAPGDLAAILQRRLEASLLPNDPRGISPDMSMIPAPLAPVICGHTAHSQAAVHAPSQADSSANLR